MTDKLLHRFWATVCKTIRPMLSDRCLSCPVCLSVCDVGILWPNGWAYKDETWYAGRPRPWPHCVRWGPSCPSAKGAKMPLGMEIALSPGDFALDRDPALPKRGHSLPNFRPMFIVVKRLDGSRCHLARRYASAQATLLDGDPPPPKGAQPPNFWLISVVAKWLDGLRCHLVWS